MGFLEMPIRFLAIYNVTQKPKYLWMAVQFVRTYFVPSYLKMMLKPDEPWSLYGGLSGMACLLIDLLKDPNKATFPFYEDL